MPYERPSIARREQFTGLLKVVLSDVKVPTQAT